MNRKRKVSNKEKNVGFLLLIKENVSHPWNNYFPPIDPYQTKQRKLRTIIPGKCTPNKTFSYNELIGNRGGNKVILFSLHFFDN